MGSQGGAFASVKHGLETVTGSMQQPKPTTTDPRTIGLDHSQCRTYAHRSIEGVAACLQQIMAHSGGQGMGRGDGGRFRPFSRRQLRTDEKDKNKAPRRSLIYNACLHWLNDYSDSPVILRYFAYNSS
jgi:hypothetical protein